MRGKIIQYNGADGNGIIMAEGRQYPFSITSWKAESPPAPGKTVEIQTEQDVVTSVAVIGDDVLLKEKASELGGKLGSALGNIDLSGLKTGSGSGSVGTGSIVERYGTVVLGSFVLFLIGTLVFNAISISMFGNSMGKSLFDVASLLSQMGGGGGGIKLILILAYFGFALPLVWRDRRAWLALLLPLLATVWAAVTFMKIGSSMGGGIASEMGKVFSIGFGFYLSIIVAIVLAVGGMQRFKRGA